MNREFSCVRPLCRSERQARRRVGRVASGLLLLAALGMAGGATELTPAEAAGCDLARRILDQRPTENSTNNAVLKIRDGRGNRREVRLELHTLVTPTNWLVRYTARENPAESETLVVLQDDSAGARYFWPKAGENSASAPCLSRGQLMQPFAGSDFWIADLGLEFLRWPAQKVLKHELRRGQACQVLESRNPEPGTNGYARVVSWIDRDTLGIVYAEAYHANGKLWKEFAPKEFKKINGQWQVREMEIRNRQTGSRTRLELELTDR